MSQATLPHVSSMPAPKRRPAAAADLARHYACLTKARLSLMVLGTTAVGYVLGAESLPAFGAGRFGWTLVGTGLAAGAANAINQVMERGRDAEMHRTRHRPLPSGRMSGVHAIAFSLVLATLGVGVLAMFVNGLSAALALFTILTYVGLYTPLKVRSSLNTLVGAICGAVPPMIGWVGATGRIEAGAWALGAILFVWQIPHFLALAWLYRADYARGRFVMLPLLDRNGRLTGQIVVLTSLMLIPLALAATLLGLGGLVFTVGSVGLGLGMGVLGVRLYRARTDANARRMFLASLVYLSTVMILLVADRGPVVAPTVPLAAASQQTPDPATDAG